MAVSSSAIRFNRRNIEALPTPNDKRLSYYCDSQPGLCVTVTPTGAKSFYVVGRAAGRPTRVRLGSFPEMTPEQAIKAGRQRLAEMSQGINPNEERRAARTRGTTFGDLWEIACHEFRSHNSAKWLKQTEQYFERFLKPWSRIELNRPAAEWIDDLQRLHLKVGKQHGHTTANHVRAIVSRVFTIAQQRQLWMFVNPAKAVKAFQTRSRERFVQPDEIKQLFAAIDKEPNDTFRDLFMVALFTGARIGNVCSMRWEDVALQRATWRIPVTKNGSSQNTHLHAKVTEILERRRDDNLASDCPSEFVFPATRADSKTGHVGYPQKAWQRVRIAAGLPDLNPHDLRRSLGSWAINSGISDAIVGQALNHRSRQSTEIYTRVSIDPVRQAVDATVDSMLQAAEEHVDG